MYLVLDVSQCKYQDELSTDPIRSDAVKLLRRMAEEGDITLLYGSKDTVYNNASILFNWLKDE
ncbi:DUF488 domain-containing protein [Clostridium algoriphilum]|uniref:DUF488 family protein n=1 Tax=Clostridium algoriphilum TaxID=198347 RepID=UPI001CF42CD9|nr:DUF488 domain-containing protein [Clostridium algoriphilum]MCB2295876.1 DUF488 domain-containing protein [Clostridium algoriphilum]